MRTLLRVIVFLIVCCITLYVYTRNRNTSQWKPEDPIDGFQELENETISSIQKKKGTGWEKAIVFFYKQNCAFSGPMVPFVRNVSAEITANYSGFGLWKVNVDIYPEITRFFGVYSTPAIVFAQHVSNEIDWTKYQDDQSIPSFVKFLDLNLKAHSIEEQKVNRVLTLDVDTFYVHVGKEANVLVFFDSVDASNEKMLSILDQVRKTITEEMHTEIAKVEYNPGNAHLYSQFVHGKMALMYFPAHSTVSIHYGGKNTYEDVYNFVKNKGLILHDEL
jgi:hypothetical protein